MAGDDDHIFGLDALSLDRLRARPGAKWSSIEGRLAAWVADMDFPIAPAITDRLVELVTTDVGYPNWSRVYRSSLPELFAARSEQRFGWTPDVERLHEVADVMQGVQVALHHLSRPGDGVVLHMPAYHPFLAAMEEMGRRLVPVPAALVHGAWTFDHDELDARLHREAARVLLLCHPHNPTGHVFTAVELEQLADIAARHGLVVISDEIHAELVHPGHRHVPFAALSTETAARTVTVTSSSKAFNLAGLRWAILHAGADDLQTALGQLPQHYLGAPNVLAVAATEAAWRDGDGWQLAVGRRLDANRHLLADLLAEHLPAAGYAVPDATYLAWLDLSGCGFEGDPANPARALRRRGVELSPGPRFGPQGTGFARLNFATSAAVLETIVTTMARVP
ncbi:MAG: aminotransferase class I/II-fold pyridoxal phosphate-dependent enzyme [Actinomycetota bacterium]|nr:aminotransferase class I/II-fold pyridoxal phosphate-dependent enzyme [Actinomycetota bacterium]